MPKVTVVQVVYNSKRFIEPVFNAIFNQTFKDFNVVAVIAGNDDGSKELLMEKFPKAKSRTVAEFLQNSDSGTGMEIIDPGYNIGFAKGHNLVFNRYQPDFFQLVNPDMVMEPNYIEEILKVFEDEKVGAATGKLYKVDSLAIATMGTIVVHNGSHCVIDTTGVTVAKSGRARDRGQYEIDVGQYDNLIDVDAVSGAGAMYRASALQATRLHLPSARADGGQASYQLQAKKEYFDEDFHSYWEDVDLAWRMTNAGWKCKFAPLAIGYHGRGAGSSKNGYKDLFGFIKHHKALSLRIRQLNYQNHIFMYIKNTKWFYPQFFVREFFMFFYVLFFEIGTFKILPQMFKLLPKMWQKRKICKNAKGPHAS